MKFLLGQLVFNNIFCATWIIPYPRNNQEKKKKMNQINFIQEN